MTSPRNVGNTSPVRRTFEPQPSTSPSAPPHEGRPSVQTPPSAQGSLNELQALQGQRSASRSASPDHGANRRTATIAASTMQPRHALAHPVQEGSGGPQALPAADPLAGLLVLATASEGHGGNVSDGHGKNKSAAEVDALSAMLGLAQGKTTVDLTLEAPRETIDLTGADLALRTEHAGMPEKEPSASPHDAAGPRPPGQPALAPLNPVLGSAPSPMRPLEWTTPLVVDPTPPRAERTKSKRKAPDDAPRSTKKAKTAPTSEAGAAAPPMADERPAKRHWSKGRTAHAVANAVPAPIKYKRPVSSAPAGLHADPALPLRMASHINALESSAPDVEMSDASPQMQKAADTSHLRARVEDAPDEAQAKAQKAAEDARSMPPPSNIPIRGRETSRSTRPPAPDIQLNSMPIHPAVLANPGTPASLAKLAKRDNRQAAAAGAASKGLPPPDGEQIALIQVIPPGFRPRKFGELEYAIGTKLMALTTRNGERRSVAELLGIPDGEKRTLFNAVLNLAGQIRYLDPALHSQAWEKIDKLTGLLPPLEGEDEVEFISQLSLTRSRLTQNKFPNLLPSDQHQPPSAIATALVASDPAGEASKRLSSMMQNRTMGFAVPKPALPPSLSNDAAPTGRGIAAEIDRAAQIEPHLRQRMRMHGVVDVHNGGKGFESFLRALCQHDSGLYGIDHEAAIAEASTRLLARLPENLDSDVPLQEHLMKAAVELVNEDRAQKKLPPLNLQVVSSALHHGVPMPFAESMNTGKLNAPIFNSADGMHALVAVDAAVTDFGSLAAQTTPLRLGEGNPRKNFPRIPLPYAEGKPWNHPSNPDRNVDQGE